MELIAAARAPGSAVGRRASGCGSLLEHADALKTRFPSESHRSSIDAKAGRAYRAVATRACRCRRIASRDGPQSVATVSRFLAGAWDIQPEGTRIRQLCPRSLTSVRRRVSCCAIDTSKLGRIVRPSHRVTGDRRDSPSRALAGNSPMSPSMTTLSRWLRADARRREKESAVDFPGGDGGALPHVSASQSNDC